MFVGGVYFILSYNFNNQYKLMGINELELTLASEFSNGQGNKSVTGTGNGCSIL